MLYSLLFRLQKEKEERDKALKEGTLVGDDENTVKEEIKPKPSWPRYAKRMIRRMKIEKVGKTYSEYLTTFTNSLVVKSTGKFQSRLLWGQLLDLEYRTKQKRNSLGILWAR